MILWQLVCLFFAFSASGQPIKASQASEAQEIMETYFDAEAYIKSQLVEKDVVVFAKSTCPFSIRAIEALKNNEVDANVVFINQDEKCKGHMRTVQSQLATHSKITTVPQVFKGGKFFGDATQTLNALKDGSFFGKGHLADL